ncbi:MAG: hypothetical protein NUW37_16900 [Planctomycetes bacterium]|nr:hypothetical protein [Planctomycetota bacterium]
MPPRKTKKTPAGNLTAPKVDDVDRDSLEYSILGVEPSSVARRMELISRIETARNSNLICFLTSLRGGVKAGITDDTVRVLIDHLRLLDSEQSNIDLLLVTHGGQSEVPWRIVSLIREYCKGEFGVLVPYRAMSAGTLIALGADQIVMGPYANLSPIDPKVTNPFNPADPGGNKIGIDVEDVVAYISFIRDQVGIHGEQHLTTLLASLADKVHPVSLGCVGRFLSQVRMMGEKLLESRNQKMQKERREHIVEMLSSKLFFHGHPINRSEAAEEIQLQIHFSDPRLEEDMWQLYLLYEGAFGNDEPFSAEMELERSPANEVRLDLLLTQIESKNLTSRKLERHRIKSSAPSVSVPKFGPPPGMPPGRPPAQPPPPKESVADVTIDRRWIQAIREGAAEKAPQPAPQKPQPKRKTAARRRIPTK